MIVSHILEKKKIKSILTVHPKMEVNDAAELLSVNRIGALVVSSNGKSVEGIISERDIVRQLAQHGPSSLSSRIDSVMTRDVVTARSTDTISNVTARMTEGRFRHMPVVEEGTLIGVISIGDVVKARMEEIETENSALAEMISGQF